MASLPVVNGRDAVRAFERLGWRVSRQSGSHIVLVKTGLPVTLSVPDHRPVATGTLRSLIRASGETVASFAAALK